MVRESTCLVLLSKITLIIFVFNTFFEYFRPDISVKLRITSVQATALK